MSCCKGIGLVKQSFKCCCRARSILTVIDHCTCVNGPSHSFAPCCCMLSACKFTNSEQKLSVTQGSTQSGSQLGSS